MSAPSADPPAHLRQTVLLSLVAGYLTCLFVLDAGKDLLALLGGRGPSGPFGFLTDAIPWWKKTTIYQIYPRSFLDSNADGIGDLPGIISKLDYIKDLGFETIWFSPFFASPQEDFGYDIAGYREIAPEYGTFEDAEELKSVVDAFISQNHSGVSVESAPNDAEFLYQIETVLINDVSKDFNDSTIQSMEDLNDYPIADTLIFNM